MFIILTFSVVYADIVIRRKLGCITFFLLLFLKGKDLTLSLSVMLVLLQLTLKKIFFKQKFGPTDNRALNPQLVRT